MDPAKNILYSNNQQTFDTEKPHSPRDEDIAAIGQKRLPSHERSEVNLEKRVKIEVPLILNLNQEFWQAAFDDQWDVVKEMLKSGDVDVNYAPRH
jgi:hypothetical protein